MSHSALGILIMLGIDVALFGVLGLTVWAIQMAWIPFWAAGVVNGLGHFIGYRNYSSPDTSTNVFPVGLIIGGEELHNNHHAHGTSCRFSAKWWEFDIGWAYIRILAFFRLATIRRVAPRLKVEPSKSSVDLATLQAVITHRYEILAKYTRMVRKAAAQELTKVKGQAGEPANAALLRRAQKLLARDDDKLAPAQLAEIETVLSKHESLSTMVQMRSELARLWESSSASSEQLLADLQAWCQRAQQSGIESLEQFALRLRRYAA